MLGQHITADAIALVRGAQEQNSVFHLAHYGGKVISDR